MNKSSNVLKSLRSYSMVIVLVVIAVLFHFLTNGLIFTPMNLTNLILGNHPAIVGIYADYCSLSDLDLSGCGGLRYLSIQGNRFTWLDLTPFPDIYTVWIADNPGMVLDISHKYSIHKWDYVPRSEWGVVYSSSALRDQTIYYKYAVYYRTEQGFWTFLPGFESVP